MSSSFLFATHNPAKVKRFCQNKLLFDLLISPQDLGLNKVEAEENGENEWENAKIKAKAYYNAQLRQKNNLNPKFSDQLPLSSISLDTGFYIENLPLDKQPGKHVQRIAGAVESDSHEIRYQKMVDYYTKIAKDQGGAAKAYFLDAFCLFDGQKYHRTEAKREALITDKVFFKDVHFPIASIYKITKFDKYYHDLDETEMQEYINTSLKAVKDLIELTQN